MEPAPQQDDSLSSHLQELLYDQIEQDGLIAGWYWPIDGEALQCSQNLCKIYQHPAKHRMPFRMFSESYTRSSRPAMRNSLEHCRRGETFCREFDFVGSKGCLKRLKISGRPIRNELGDIQALAGSVEDISSAWLDHTRHQLALDAAGIGVWEYNVASDSLFWSDQMFRIYGRPHKQHMTLADWEAGVHPDDLPIARQTFDQALANRQLFTTEFRVMQTDTTVIHVRAVARAFYDDNDQPVKAIGINMDITALKDKESALSQERAQSVKQAKLAAVGELAAGIGHEINNPLAIAVGNMELLKDALIKRGVMDDDLRPFFDKHTQSTNRIKQIVAGMRRLVRDEAHEALSVISIKELLNNIVGLLAEIYAKQGITLRLSQVCEASVSGHFGELQQVFMNLISNAKDAVINSQEKVITLSARREGEDLCISVADTGLGIKSENLNRIFDSFYTEKMSGQGTGLGLSIAERIVREHGGTIIATSEFGLGAMFHVRLPECEQPPDLLEQFPVPQSVEDSDVSLDTAQLSAVIVDDEPMILTVVKAFFESLGIRVFATTQQRLAIKALATGDYKVLVTDMCMPNGDGLSLIRQVRESSLPNPRFVLMTGGIVNDLKEAEKRDIESLDGIIQKPFNREDIVNALINLGDLP